MNIRSSQQADAFMLWIDAVGGFWVCLGDAVTIGQPSVTAGPDVPILADLSGRHARIRRDSEGYSIEALREVRVDGRPAPQMAWLGDGSRIELGQGVRLAFRRPHALSGTARLDYQSVHRTQPMSDAVLLMSDSLLIGPRPHCHIVCRDWTREVILYRNDDALFCRSPGTLTIDGKSYTDRGPLQRNSHVSGDGFSFSLEPITRG